MSIIGIDRPPKRLFNAMMNAIQRALPWWSIPPPPPPPPPPSLISGTIAAIAAAVVLVLLVTFFFARKKETKPEPSAKSQHVSHTSIHHMSQLLKTMGRLEEARPLLEVDLQACRETLGDRHTRTLTSISAMGLLLRDMGKLEEARPLLEEALQARRETLGDNHPHTLLSISNMSQLEEATRSLPDHTRRRGGMCYAAIDTMGVLLTHISSWGRRPREEELQV